MENELTPLQLRQNEVAQYRANIEMYKTILDTLPTQWPEHLLGYKGTSKQHASAAEVENLDDVELLAKLWHADDIKAAIRAEMVEMTKAASILAVLEAQQ